MEAQPELALVVLESLQDPRQAEGVRVAEQAAAERREADPHDEAEVHLPRVPDNAILQRAGGLVDHDEDGALLDEDRKSTRLNSSHVKISYAVFCLKKKIKIIKK